MTNKQKKLMSSIHIDEQLLEDVEDIKKKCILATGENISRNATIMMLLKMGIESYNKGNKWKKN